MHTRTAFTFCVLLLTLMLHAGAAEPAPVQPADFLKDIKTHQDLMDYFRLSYDWRALNLLMARAGHPKSLAQIKQGAAQCQRQPAAIGPLFAKLGVVRNGPAFLTANEEWWQKEFGEQAIAIQSNDYLVLGTKKYAVFARTAAYYMQKVLDGYKQIHGFTEVREGKFLIKIYPGQKSYDAQDFNKGTNATFRPHKFFLAVWVDTKMAKKKKNEALTKMLQILFHEAFHMYLHYYVPHPPMWMDEGTAEVMEASQIRGETLGLGGGAIHEEDLKILKHFLKKKETRPLQEFVGLNKKEYKQNPELNYTQGWGFVHFLLYAQNGKYRHHYDDVIVLLRNGASTEEAVARAFSGVDWDVMQKAWEAYIAGLKPDKQKSRVIAQ